NPFVSILNLLVARVHFYGHETSRTKKAGGRDGNPFPGSRGGAGSGTTESFGRTADRGQHCGPEAGAGRGWTGFEDLSDGGGRQGDAESDGSIQDCDAGEGSDLVRAERQGGAAGCVESLRRSVD